MPERRVRFPGYAAQKPVAGAATAWVQADEDGHASCIVKGWSPCREFERDMSLQRTLFSGVRIRRFGGKEVTR
jgi:hypothetical protein